MSRLFQRPTNISFDSIEKYIDSYNGSNDILLYKYIYLLSKKYAIDLRFKFSNNEKLDLFSTRCASRIYSIICNNKDNLKFKDIFNNISNDILNSLSHSNDTKDDLLDTSYNNYIISKIKSVNFNGLSDVSNFSEYIYEFIKKIPKKKMSSEWHNLYKSVLLSFYKTINFYGEDLFDYDVVIYPKLHLYNLSDLYSEYVSIIVLQLIYNLRDSFNKIVSSKVENVFTLHFKELLNGN